MRSVSMKVVIVCLLIMASAMVLSEPLHGVDKRSFNNMCRGVHDAQMTARLDRLCDDCYHLFREAELYGLCRDECYTSHYFKGCMDVLHETDNEELFKEYIKQLHGADPNLR